MKKKNISFEQLSDIMAFRIIVPKISECYKILGIIHEKYHNIPNSFKDYISTPKNNGYRSIHTLVIGPSKQKIEIQIRTEEMHQIAEFGIAAHWCYKEGVDFRKSEDNYGWINELLNILEFSSDPTEFINNTRLEMYQDQVFCFSPKGALIALPQGSTPIDFAYAIHSDIGNTCIGVKINGVISPVRTILNNGDQVDIISSVNQHPSESWEEFVVTGKARTQIRKYIRSSKRDSYLRQGKNILEDFFAEKKVQFAEKNIINYLHLFSKESIEDLFVAIGEGLLSKEDIFSACYPNYKVPAKSKRNLLKLLGRNKDHHHKNFNNQEHDIKGLIPDMSIHFAGCCHPLPGDKITGLIHAGKGITIHISKCVNIHKDKVKDNSIKLHWKKDHKVKNYM